MRHKHTNSINITNFEELLLEKSKNKQGLNKFNKFNRNNLRAHSLDLDLSLNDSGHLGILKILNQSINEANESFAPSSFNTNRK